MVPDVAVVVCSAGDVLRAIHGRAAANGKHEVDVVRTDKLAALLHKRELGIGDDSAELKHLDALRLEAHADACNEREDESTCIEVEEDARASTGRDLGSDPVLGSSAEDDLLGVVVHEIDEHGVLRSITAKLRGRQIRSAAPACMK